MITKEDVLATLNAMGFETEDLGEMGHLFRYDNTKFLYMPDEDDDNFLRFAIPSIYDVTDDNREAVHEIVNKVNMQMKYIKLCVWGDDVWVFFEYRIFEIPELEAALELIIRALNAGHARFARIINCSNESVDNEDTTKEDND